MVEIRSALAPVWRPGRHGSADGPAGLAVAEIADRDLIQLSTFPDRLRDVRAKLAAELGLDMPDDTGIAAAAGGHTVFAIAPERFWIAGPRSAGLFENLSRRFAGEMALLSELGHSRTLLRLAGPGVRDVMAKALPVDLHVSVFADGAFAQSALHHVPVLVHRCARDGADGFDLYVPRSYALSLFEWLMHAAAEFGLELTGR